MKMKDFLTDIKTYIGLAVFLVMIGVAFAGWANLPDKVKSIEEKANKTENNVQTLAANLDKYIAVNESQKEADKEQKALMLELIKEVKEIK